jgi:tripartite-type tricarboxylate transporter receptor subunit TctC
MMFDAITTMAQQARAGKVRAIATTGRVRSDVTPEIPTVGEAGVPGYEATIWLGFMAPAGTPKPIIDKLNAAITRIVGQPDVRATWAQQGAVPMTMTPEEFERYLRDDIAKWANVVKTAKIKVD